jgi:hypothetical protein
LPEDPATLKASLLAALAERDREQQHAEAQEALAREKSALAAQQGKRADDLYLQTLRLQLELERYKQWYYGPRADRLQSSGELGQVLLNFGEQLEQTPVHPEDVAAGTAPATEGRRGQRRRGRRALASFENLPVTTQVYELQGKERACPCCGGERQEIGAEESWQIEYLPGRFERIQHVRKKYACTRCEASGDKPQKLLGWKEQLLPKHPMAEAVNYTLGQWNELTVFCSDGAVPIDNNVSEREMKRVVLNRKNSLFVGNPRGGRTAAILATLTSTCRRHQVDPQLYLTQLLMNLPSWPVHDLDACLPDQWKLRHAARLATLNQHNPTAPDNLSSLPAE